MIIQNKIGVGIITHNRPDYYKQVLQTIPRKKIDCFVVINDGVNCYADLADADHVVFNKQQLGVSKTKNKAVNYLIENNCTDIFILEDDVIIKRSDVFEAYIKASEKTNVCHLCFGPVEIMKNNPSNLKFSCDYGNGIKLDFYHNPQGGFMYFKRKAIDSNQLFDEQYMNAFEHIDVAYNLIKKNMLPPFWYFPDIGNSKEFLASIPDSSVCSTITNKEKYNLNLTNSASYFVKKWGVFTNQIPDVGIDQVVEKLKQIKTNG